jgi:PhoH-like ATPase
MAKEKKIFVLDTSVILYAADAIMNFDEHDVGIPITVLEELDNFKKGNDIKNFEAREFIRLLDKLSKDHTLQNWIPLNGSSKGKFKVLMNSSSKLDAEIIFDEQKPDHKILNAALQLKEEEKNRKVILVTKDINLRLKAKSLNLIAEDYETGKIKNVSKLHSGKTVVEHVETDIINGLYDEGHCTPGNIVNGEKPISNDYFILKSPKNSVLAYYNPIEKCIQKVEKKSVYGIKPKNAEVASQQSRKEVLNRRSDPGLFIPSLCGSQS